MRTKTRVMIVDDHVLVAKALSDLIAEQSDMTVVGVAHSVAQSVELAAEISPDVVLMDFRLPDGTGDEACASIREMRPLTRLIIVTRDDSTDVRRAAAEAGASAFIHKSRAATDLVGAIRRVAA
ncbi:MAG TPA: response regulator transcription factor [Candidatus Udaeobacter sp.]|nr:response regulator transcription factor [Candidatus Udaeobacter sp.]